MYWNYTFWFILISDIGQDEELYESIYEVIGPKSSGGGSADFESESDFDEILEEPGSGNK